MCVALALWLLLAGSGPAPDPRVTVDYDRNADFSRYATYRWVAPHESEKDPLSDQRLVSGIDFHLALRGLRRMGAGEPDLRVTYHSDSSDEVVIDSRALGFHFGSGWYWGAGPVSSASAVHRYARGSLVVDLWEADTGRLVWRGSASDVTRTPPPRRDEGLAPLLAGLFARYPPPPSR